MGANDEYKYLRPKRGSRYRQLFFGRIRAEEIDRDFAALATLCEASEPADEEQLERALGEARRQAKEQVRRHMGLA